jgi:hypothetical protein
MPSDKGSLDSVSLLANLHMTTAPMYAALVDILDDVAAPDKGSQDSVSLLRAVRRFQVEHELGTFAPLTTRRVWHSAWTDVVARNVASKVVAVRTFVKMGPMLDVLERAVARGIRPSSVIPEPRIVARLAGVKTFATLSSHQQAARVAFAAGRVPPTASVAAYVRCVSGLEAVGVGTKRAADLRDCDDVVSEEARLKRSTKRAKEGDDGIFAMGDLSRALQCVPSTVSWPPSAEET